MKFNPQPKPVKLDKKDRPSGKPFMKGYSDKRAAEMEQYNREAKEFVKGKICPITNQPATEVHHKKGRIGKLLLDKRFWLAVSRNGHNKINNNPIWAMQMGYTISRLAKDK